MSIYQVFFAPLVANSSRLHVGCRVTMMICWLAGYVPLHKRCIKTQAIKMPPPPTGKVLVDYGRVQGKSSVHLMSVKNPHKAQSWSQLKR